MATLKDDVEVREKGADGFFLPGLGTEWDVGQAFLEEFGTEDVGADPGPETMRATPLLLALSPEWAKETGRSSLHSLRVVPLRMVLLREV